MSNKPYYNRSTSNAMALSEMLSSPYSGQFSSWCCAFIVIIAILVGAYNYFYNQDDNNRTLSSSDTSISS